MCLLIDNQTLHNLYIIIVKHLDICKSFASKLADEKGIDNRKDVISDLEVIALSVISETLGIDSESFRSHIFI